MKKTTGEIDAQQRRMLELLAGGASTREIGQEMGYQEGTIRVYLHDLYKKLGVANKTSAVIWFMERAHAKERAAHAEAPVEPGPAAGEDFGDMAQRTDLRTALGAMTLFLGPHGRLWEVAQRLKGSDIDAGADTRRRRSRILWEALLRGDFAYAKHLHDEGKAADLVSDSPADAVTCVAMLTLGGYTGAAEKLTSLMARRKRGGTAGTSRELGMLKALEHALDDGRSEAFASLHQVARDPANPAVKHLAMAALFHAYVARKDAERARKTANALWTEAEGVRQHLQAMGERPMVRDVALPEPEKATREAVGAYLGKAVLVK